MRSSDIAYDHLRLMITTAVLKPGEVINETALTQQLGMGRTPVREALNRLSWDQFVRIIPRQCIIVSELPLQELESIYQMRYTLSQLEGELSAHKRTSEDIAGVKKIVMKIKEETVPSKRVMLDRAFHNAISHMTKNTFLEQEMNNTLDLSLRLLFLNQEHLISIDDLVVDEYELMVTYLEEQKSEELIALLQQHVINFRNKFLSGVSPVKLGENSGSLYR